MEKPGYVFLLTVVVVFLSHSSRWLERDLPHAVGGYVHPAFQKVYDVFKKNIQANLEKGACFSAYYKGELVVDLWGGYSDIEAGRQWKKDTLSIMFSSTKGVSAILVALFVQKGYLDYNKLVSYYWPEFGKNGKENITVEMLLSHQAGLSITNGTIDIRLLRTNPRKVEAFLEEQRPVWKPGTAYSYHVITFGMYVDVLLRKADPKHRNVDQIFRDEIATPFDIDIHYGMPRSELHRNSRFVPLSLTNIIKHTFKSFSLHQLKVFLTIMNPMSMFMRASYSGFNQEPTLRNPNEDFKYATVRNSAVEMYFKRQVELSTMYRQMEPRNYKTAEEAIQDIVNMKLQAFIWDSSRLEYEAGQNCDLITVGDLFGRSGLGVGLQKKSPWTSKISMAILKLHEKGNMEDLDNKWILEGRNDCPEKDTTPATLGLTNMASVFLMVAGGIIAGIILIVIEIAYKRHRGLKDKELELARNAADRWRGNIEKRKLLRESWDYIKILKDREAKVKMAEETKNQ